MANLLRRLLRGRSAPQNAQLQPDEPAPEPAGPAAPEPPAPEGPPEVEGASRFEARPKRGRGPRRTSDEVSSIGPGEP